MSVPKRATSKGVSKFPFCGWYCPVRLCFSAVSFVLVARVSTTPCRQAKKIHERALYHQRHTKTGQGSSSGVFFVWTIADVSFRLMVIVVVAAIVFLSLLLVVLFSYHPLHRVDFSHFRRSHSRTCLPYNHRYTFRCQTSVMITSQQQSSPS